jgi:hypothetical protein
VSPNYVALGVVFLFVGSAVSDFISGNQARGWFYVFSAAINLTVLFMK